MASPCTNDPNEVINAVVGIQAAEETFERELDDAVDAATENADKLDSFVNGTDTQIVQLGEGAPTPTIRNVVRQMMSAASELPNADVSGKSSTANGGSELRTLAARFGDIVNVLDFGAKGDGVTDDTAAFQAAAATGKAVFIPAGTYAVDGDFPGKFYSDGAVTAGNIPVVDVSKQSRRQHMLDIAASLVSPTQFFSSSNFPNRPYSDYYFEGIAYDTKRDVFYLGQNHLVDETTAGYITTMSDPTDVSTITSTVASVNGHYNDMEYDENNDLLYIAPAGPDNNVDNVIYVLDPLTKNRLTDWVVSGRIWTMAVKGDYLYTYIGGYIFRYNTTTREKDESFSIKINEVPRAENESNHNQGLFFIDDILVHCGAVHNEEMSGQRRCTFTLIDIYSGDVSYCGYNVDNNNELEGATVKNGVVYQLFANDYVIGIALSPVGLFTVSGRYTKRITTDNRYNDFNKIIDRGKYLINTGTTMLALGHKPESMRESNGGKLDVERMCSDEIVEQKLTIESGEIYRRVGSFKTNTWSKWIKYGFNCLYKGTDTTSCNDFSSGGLVHPFGLTDAPDGTAGFILTLQAENGGYTGGVLKQLYFMRVGTLNTYDHRLYIRQGLISSGSVSWGNWTQIITAKDPYPGDFIPTQSNTYSLGDNSHRWANIYASTGEINSSDERLKDNIENPSEALMRAWGKVNFKVFQFKDAIAEKGAGARKHVGVIAQQIQSAFESEGLNANKYGLFCHDSWEDSYEEVEVFDEDAQVDEDGNVISPEKTHMERKLVQKAGDAYSVRYEECLALECAYQRWLGEKRDEKIAELEARLNEFPGNSSAPSGASPDNI